MTDGRCPICHELVQAKLGFILRHGVHIHGRLHLCAGSGTPICVFTDKGCCS